MCPLCIGTATLLLSSGTSAGGLGALLFRRRLHRFAFRGQRALENVSSGPDQEEVRNAGATCLLQTHENAERD